MSSLSVAIVGASGYMGAELIRLLLQHPRVELAAVYGRRAAGQTLPRVFPQFSGVLTLPLEEFAPDRAAERAELVFTALPHGESAEAVAALRQRGATVIDLSADFRLRSPDEYARWYGSPGHAGHPAPAQLAEAVYGLPELYRRELAAARLVAAPGCNPTASILAVAPLLARGLVAADGLVVDAKSGVSGAGRSPALSTHFPEVGEGVRAYKVAGTHRHTPEIEQELGRCAGRPLSLLFTPHLVPMARGILACVYGTATEAALAGGQAVLQQALEEAYRGEPFVHVLPPDQLPDTAHVRGSNRAHLGVRLDPRTGRVLAMSAIDNLVKGGSGQAVQCMNVLRGWAEETGLGATALFP
jgi:N-acetyl-gamma-glutamyl-phosphate reductase